MAAAAMAAAAAASRRRDYTNGVGVWIRVESERKITEGSSKEDTAG